MSRQPELAMSVTPSPPSRADEIPPGPRSLQRVLRDKSEIYRKDPRSPAAREKAPGQGEQPDYRFVGGQSVALSEGDAWRRQRTMVQPIFGRRALTALCTVAAEETAQMLERC